MTESEIISSASMALNVIGVIVTVATFYYAREAASKFGTSTVGKASKDISYGTVLLVGFMILNTVNDVGLSLIEPYSAEVGLVLNLALVGGIFFYAMAFNRLADVLE